MNDCRAEWHTPDFHPERINKYICCFNYSKQIPATDIFTLKQQNPIQAGTKKLRLMQSIMAEFGYDKKKKNHLMILGTLFLYEFDKKFQVFRIHIGQNAVTEIENMA